MLLGVFSSPPKGGLLSSCCAWVFHCSGFSRGGAQALGCAGSSCDLGLQSVEHELSCPVACGILFPGPEIEPMFPALAGRFLTTGPPGKSKCKY